MSILGREDPVDRGRKGLGKWGVCGGDGFHRIPLSILFRLSSAQQGDFLIRAAQPDQPPAQSPALPSKVSMRDLALPCFLNSNIWIVCSGFQWEEKTCNLIICIRFYWWMEGGMEERRHICPFCIHFSLFLHLSSSGQETWWPFLPSSCF